MNVSRVYRLLRLITMLQSGRSYTADELAVELEISRRTVFRDLNMLELAHIPYYFDDARQGYSISKHFFLPPVNLTLSEALAVLMLTGRRGKAAIPLFSEGTKAAVKIESSLPGPVRQHVGSIIDKMSFSLGPVSRHEGLDGMFSELVEAIGLKKVCRLVYISFHERKQITLDVHPLRLVFLNRAWYLIAHSGKHEQVRTFKLGRVRRLSVLNKTFTVSSDIDADNYFGLAWSMIPEGTCHDVHLHFDAKVAGNVAEVRWHSTQKVQWNDDGSMEFTANVDGLGEITWWVLGYGDQVLVVSPPELRRRVVDVAGGILRKYDSERI